MGSPRRPAAPPPPPPPPAPPPLPPPPGPPSPCAAGGGRLRALHWEPLPAARVRGRRSVWAPRAAPVPLDLPRLRQLFQEPRGASPGQRPPPAVSLLEPKRSLALGVFLKQLKRPVRQIVLDIRDGVGAPYGAEKLRELSRMLPSAGEVARLRSFPGSPRQLADPELFMLLLTQVPSYARRLELLVLKEEFFPRLGALRTAIQTLTDAAVEVLECEELHAILHLVLRAGNYLNSGGYAGSAAGFRLASLLKLPDTKANEPGTDLLHFVAAEAAKAEKGLLDFPSKLPHVGPASRVEEAEVEGELRRLAERLARARGRPGEQGAGPQLQPFLRAADGELRAARGALEQLRRAAAAALDFYCEEAAPGGLQQLCAVLHRFAGRFLLAVQENRAREQAQRRRQQLERERQKRRSVATCSARDVAPRDAGTGRPFPGTPQPGRHPWLSPRPGAEPGPGGSPPASPGCGSPVLPLLRRHTAPALPALPRAPGCAEPPPATPALAPAGSTGGPSGHGTEPPAPAAAPAPGGPARFSLASLFQKKGAPPELGAPDPPQAPRDGSALLAFLRRLAGGRARGAPPS